MTTAATRQFTQAQEEILQEMIRSISNAPVGPSGRRDWRFTRNAILRAATRLTQAGVNRFEAKRLADRYAAHAHRHPVVQ